MKAIILKAIKLRYDTRPYSGILHKNVVEVGTTGNGSRILKCNDCNQTWVESINNPQVISDDVAENLEDYYPKVNVLIKACNDTN